jgi:hypothetical protein
LFLSRGAMPPPGIGTCGTLPARRSATFILLSSMRANLDQSGRASNWGVPSSPTWTWRLCAPPRYTVAAANNCETRMLEHGQD